MLLNRCCHWNEFSIQGKVRHPEKNTHCEVQRSFYLLYFLFLFCVIFFVTRKKVREGREGFPLIRIFFRKCCHIQQRNE